MEIKTVLVTGCYGFIGYHLSSRLLKLGVKVFGLDLLDIDINYDFKVIRKQILAKNPSFSEMDSIDDVLTTQKIDLVIHLGAKTGVRDSLEQADGYIRSNVTASNALFHLSASNKVPVVYASSSSVYGLSNEVELSEEQSTNSPVSIYGMTKVATENLAFYYAHKFGTSFIGLRFFTVYGPLPRKDMAIYQFIDKIQNGLTIDVYGDGLARDFTYIDDILDGILKACERASTTICNNEVYNLGYGKAEPIDQMIKLIEANLGKKAMINLAPKAFEDMQHTQAVNHKTKEVLGWSPKVDLAQGIAKTVAWYKSYFNI